MFWHQVIPSAVGLGGLILLALAFIGALANDVVLRRGGLTPAWFLSLRLVLTAVVVVCLVIAIISV